VSGTRSGEALAHPAYCTEPGQRGRRRAARTSRQPQGAVRVRTGDLRHARRGRFHRTRRRC